MVLTDRLVTVIHRLGQNNHPTQTLEHISTKISNVLHELMYNVITENVWLVFWGRRWWVLFCFNTHVHRQVFLHFTAKIANSNILNLRCHQLFHIHQIFYSNCESFTMSYTGLMNQLNNKRQSCGTPENKLRTSNKPSCLQFKYHLPFRIK